MKLKTIFALSFWILLLAISCKTDDISFDAPSQALRFSRDTVFCDTVYHQVRSETYAVKVYNQEDKDVMIPKISLKGGNASPYRINLDGKPDTEFRNVPLRKKDSLFIFVEIAPVANATQAIAEDKIQFQALGTQDVTLFSVVQDAEFFIQNKNNPNILNTNTTWTNKKAKIIFGDLTLAEGKSLNIEAGTKVYFTKNSSLKLSKSSTLNVSGDLGNEVVFRGDRNDTRYDTIPLNWKGITAEPGAILNFNYAKIFGGETGILIKSATANIKNTIIHTFQTHGILAVASTLKAENMVMNNCGEADLALQKGGSIDLTHCTLANYWRQNSALPSYGILAANEWKNAAGTAEYGALSLNVRNSIIYGDKETAVMLKPTTGQTFNYLFDSSLLKYSTNSGFNFDGNPWVINSIKNEAPLFTNYFVEKMNLRVAAKSPAKGKARLTTAQSVPLDMVKISRTTNPTIGAYQ